MQTPVGQECEFYYEDFHRDRDRQECRLIARNRASEPWQPSLCKDCPVPAIRRANRCPDMVLIATAARHWWLWKRVKVNAFCLKTQRKVPEPKIGCGECLSDHPGVAFWKQVLEE